MQRKLRYGIFLIILLFPMIHLFDNFILRNTPVTATSDIPLRTSATTFGARVYIGDPFSSPYSSYEFDPTDDVLITGAVKNLGGASSVIISLWLVEGMAPYIPIRLITNLSGSVPLGTSATFKSLNGGDVTWNVNYEDAGTYRILAQVITNNVVQTETVSKKNIIVRQYRLADFTIQEVTAQNEFFVKKEIPLPSVSVSYGLTYHNGYLYMTDFLNNALLKVDPNNGSIVTTIPITGYQGSPYGLATDHKSGFYIAYRNNNEYIRVNWDGSLNFAESSPSTHPMALTMLGSYLGITHDSSNVIKKIMPFSGSPVDDWTVTGIYLYGLTVAYGQIWYSDVQNKKIRGIDYTTHVENYVLDTGDWRGLAFDGTYLWAWDKNQKKLIQFHPKPMKFQYNITNVGNCYISGNLEIQLQQLVEEQSKQTRGVGQSPFIWTFYDEVFSSTHADGISVFLARGESLMGTIVIGLPSSASGIFRVYMGLLNDKGQILQNLNGSMPYKYQGSVYIDSDKVPRLKIDRSISHFTDYFVPEEVNVTLNLKVVGKTPSEIGIFNISKDLLLGIANINIEEELNEDVIPDSQNRWYQIDNGAKNTMPSSAVVGNKYLFNYSSFDQESRFQSMNPGEKMQLKYNLQANFTPVIKRNAFDKAKQVDPIFEQFSGNSENVGFRDDLVISKGTRYDSVQLQASELEFLVPVDFGRLFITSQIGIIVYLGRMLDLYDGIDVLGLIIKLILWARDLPAWYEAVLYIVDDDMDDQLDFMGLTAAQQATYNGMDMADQAGWLFDHIDHNLIAQAIEECVTSEAEEEDWEYIMLIGGHEVIPQRILPSPRAAFLASYAAAEVATDFFYGDWTPEANLAVDGYQPECVVSRLPGRTPLDIAHLLDQGDVNSPTTGHVGLISYYKGEDSMRRLESEWPAVKGTLYESEGEYTDNLVQNFLNPTSGDYGGNANNFDYAFILFSDHAGTSAYGDGGVVSVTQADLAGFGDYVDGHRPFYYFRACRAGWIEDPGVFKHGNTYGVGDSICLDMLEKGAAGIIGSTRNSQSPSPQNQWVVLVNSAIRPNGATASVSGTYRTGTFNIDGTNVDVYLSDTAVAGVYNEGGLDMNNDNIFQVNERFADDDYLVSETFTVYHFNIAGNNLNIEDNGQEDWNDIFAQYLTGEVGYGLMDGANVGTAFYNAKRSYWAYMQSGAHAAGSGDEACDFQQIYEFNLYGVPIYNPDIQDPPGTQNYTAEFTPIDEWGFNATFEVQNYTQSSFGIYDLFTIAGTVLTSGEGQPRLPVIMENVTLPADFDVTNIEVVANITTQLPGTYNISRGGAPDEDGAPSSKFSASETYPSTNLFSYTTMKDKDGSTLLYLYVYPFQWDSTTGIVTYTSNLTLSIEHDIRLEDSVSLAVSKTPDTKKIGRGSNIHVQLEVVNNGSSPIYNIDIKEYFGDEFQESAYISSLSISGLNNSHKLGFVLQAPAKWFSGWVETETRITFQDGAGTQYSMIVTESIYVETWMGIMILVLCLIVAIAVTVLILKYR
ncbi:MAG: hypothetical protein ACTSRC_10875 [Candidatus Helarchaeota archaeon]